MAILRVVGGLVAIVLIKKLPRCDDNTSSGNVNVNWGLVAITFIQKVAQVV